MPDRVLEVPVVLKGVSHVLVVWALRVENLIQCPYPPPTGCAAGSSRWWPSGVHFLPGPLFPAVVRLLVYVSPRCRVCGLCSSDEVLSLLIRVDVDVCLPEQLFRGAGAFGRIARTKAESLDP
jgi:hypothetical protein